MYEGFDEGGWVGGWVGEVSELCTLSKGCCLQLACGACQAISFHTPLALLSTPTSTRLQSPPSLCCTLPRGQQQRSRPLAPHTKPPPSVPPFHAEPLLLDPSLFVMYMAGADSSAATLEFMQEAYLNTTTSADVAAAAANATLSGLDGPADDGALPAPPPAGEAAPLTAAVGAAAAPASEAALPAEPAEPGVEAADEAALLALPPVPEPATAAAAAPLAASPAQEAAAPAAETSPLNATTLDITALTPEQRGCVAYVVLSEANHFGITGG